MMTASSAGVRAVGLKLVNKFGLSVSTPQREYILIPPISPPPILSPPFSPPCLLPLCTLTHSHSHVVFSFCHTVTLEVLLLSVIPMCVCGWVGVCIPKYINVYSDGGGAAAAQ
jgi:hypothetical protein